MAKIDSYGIEVDYLIDFKEFEEKFLAPHNIRNCHDFTKKGFLFDEIASWGMYDCTVGFKTIADVTKYRAWINKNEELVRKSKKGRKA